MLPCVRSVVAMEAAAAGGEQPALAGAARKALTQLEGMRYHVRARSQAGAQASCSWATEQAWCRLGEPRCPRPQQAGRRSTSWSSASSCSRECRRCVHALCCMHPAAPWSRVYGRWQVRGDIERIKVELEAAQKKRKQLELYEVTDPCLCLLASHS